MEKEKQLLESIKNCLLSKNDEQCLRLIEKYGLEQKEINIIPSYEEGLKYTDEQVIFFLNMRLMSVGIVSSLKATEIWFNQYKK